MSLTQRSGHSASSRVLRVVGGSLQVCFVLASLGGVAHAHAPRGEELARLDALLREQPQDTDLRLRRAGLRIEVGLLDGAASDLLWAGRNTELTWLNGAIVVAGKRLGVPTPGHEWVVALISSLEASGARSRTWTERIEKKG